MAFQSWLPSKITRNSNEKLKKKKKTATTECRHYCHPDIITECKLQLVKHSKMIWCHCLHTIGIIRYHVQIITFSALIQLHYLFCLYPTPIKANIILGFMALFPLRYQYVEIIVCWEIKLHYCVSFSCLINNDGWLLFSSAPATILSSSPCE